MPSALFYRGRLPTHASVRQASESTAQRLLAAQQGGQRDSMLDIRWVWDGIPHGRISASADAGYSFLGSSSHNAGGDNMGSASNGQFHDDAADYTVGGGLFLPGSRQGAVTEMG